MMDSISGIQSKSTMPIMLLIINFAV